MATDKVLSTNQSYDKDQNEYFQKEDVQHEAWEKMGIIYGLIAGVLMSVYLTIINWGEEIGLTYHFLKYIFLGIVIAIALGKYKTKAPKFSYFKRGIMLGGAISFISALIVGLSNILMYFYAPNATFQKFGLRTDAFADALTLSGVLLFEIFALGMILTFICLQYYKRNVRMR